MYKLLGLICCVAVASAADLSVGKDGGNIIYDQNVTASPAIWQQTQYLTVNASEGTVISQIVVIDNRPEKDGEAHIVEGGEGQKNVTIELKSPAVFRGFNFTVKVFAAPGSGDSPVPYNPTSTGMEVQNPSSSPSSSSTTESGLSSSSFTEGVSSSSSSTEGVASSSTTTEAGKSKNQDKIIYPGLVGQEQIRSNRDTKYETKVEPEPIPVDTVTIVKANDSEDGVGAEPIPVYNPATVKTNETQDGAEPIPVFSPTTVKTNETHDGLVAEPIPVYNPTVKSNEGGNLKETLDSVLGSNSTETSSIANAPVKAITAEDGDDDEDEEKTDVADDHEKIKRYAVKEPPKEEPTTTEASKECKTTTTTTPTTTTTTEPTTKVIETTKYEHYKSNYGYNNNYNYGKPQLYEQY